MVINENLSQINTFVGGMNTDVSDSLLENNQYKYAKNIRVTADGESKSGRVNLIPGVNNLNILYTYQDPDVNRNFKDTKIIAIDSIKNYVCLLTQHIIEGAYKWCIFVNENYGKGEYELLFGPCDEMIWDPEADSPGIYTQLRWISDSNIKLYISSPLGKYPIMYINLANTSTTLSTAGRYKGSSILLLGILDTETLLQKPTANIIPEGTLKGPILYYCYRTYKANGEVSQISPFSDKITLYNIENKGLLSNENSNCGVKITISSEALAGNNRVSIYRIQYGSATDIPEIYEITDIYSNDIGSSETFTVIDTGTNTNSVQISAEEFIKMYDKSDILPKVECIKDDRMFVADTKNLLDSVDELFAEIDTIAVTSGNGSGSQYEHEQFTSDHILNYDESYWKNKNDEIGGDGEYVSWIEKRLEYTFDYLDLSEKNSVKCFRSGEQYRFAIIFYTSEGRRTNPKWICDIMFQDPSITHNSVTVLNDTITATCTVEISYPQFIVDVNKIKSKIPSFVGYEIVIGERDDDRDILCLSEGFISGKPSHYYENGNKVEYNDDFISYSPNSVSTGDIVRFFSPESIYSGLYMIDYLKDKESITQLNLSKIYKAITSRMLWGDGGNNFVFFTTAFSKIGLPYVGLRYNIDQSRDGNIVTNYNMYSNSPNAYLAGYQNMYIPGETISNKPTFLKNHRIQNCALPKIPSTYGAIKNIPAYKTYIDGKEFNSWNYDNSQSTTLLSLDYRYNNSGTMLFYPATFSGKCILLNLATDDEYDNHGGVKATNSLAPNSMPMFICKIKIKNVPYGGHNILSIKNTSYYSVGAYNKYDTGQVDIYNTGKSMCFGIFKFWVNHNYFDDTYHYLYGSIAKTCMIPIFSSIDLQGLIGANTNRLILANELPNATIATYVKVINQNNYVTSSLVQTHDLYEYPSAYNAYNNLIVHRNTVQEDKLLQPDYRNRIYASQPSLGGEKIDPLLDFTSLKYIDINTKHGDITGLVSFNNRLYFWQEGAFGVVGTNEQAITATKDNVDMIIGTGGLFLRYDYISEHFGLAKNEKCYAVTDNNIYWYDSNRKEILMYNGLSVVALSVIKGVTNYIKTGANNKNPQIMYDDENREVIFTVVNNESIVYSEQLQRFTAIYEISPTAHTRNIKYKLISNKNDIYAYDVSKDGEKSYGFDNKPLYPYIKYIVNKSSSVNKTFDNIVFGDSFYPYIDDVEGYKHNLLYLKFAFSTNLNQYSECFGNAATYVENDFRMAIPRNGVSVNYGNRMRGKTMECEISSSNNSTDFSLLYITTKFRTSWT